MSGLFDGLGSDVGGDGEMVNANEIIRDVQSVLDNFDDRAMNPYAQSTLAGQKELLIEFIKYLEFVRGEEL